MVPQKWGPEDVLEARPVSPGLREETEISQGFSKLGARSLVRAAISRGLLSSRAALITASWMLCPLQSIFHVNYILCSRQKGGRVKGERTLSPLVAQTVENLPVLRETWVQSLGWEDPWRRNWQSTPVFLPRKSHGQRRLVGYSPWGCKE